MNWYRVKIASERGTAPWCRHVQAVDEQAAVIMIARQDYEIISIKLDKQWGPSLERKVMWRNVWARALAAMPKRVRFVPIHSYNAPPAAQAVEYGHYAALARCLGMRTNRFTHQHISCALHCGYRPKDDKRRKRLLKLAGPYGALLARVKLTQMGVAKRYKIWPE